MRNQSKNTASYNVCQKPSKSLSKAVAQKTAWSPSHTYQEHFKNEVCLKNTITYTTSSMLHRKTCKVKVLTEMCLMAPSAQSSFGNEVSRLILFQQSRMALDSHLFNLVKHLNVASFHW